MRTHELTQKLAEAEAVIAALLSGQIDAVVDRETATPVLLAQAQDALRVSEERYRRIVETTSEGVWIIDADQRTTFMNRRMEEMLGCAPGMGMGRPAADFFDEAGRSQFAAQASGTGIGQFETRYVRGDGTSLWVLVEATNAFGADGSYDGSLAMVMDITQRKRAEMETLRINRALQMLSECNLAMIRAADEQQLLDDTCRVPVAIGGYRMAWVGYARDDEHSTIETMAYAGPARELLDGLALTWSGDAAVGEGLAPELFRTGEPVICPDIEAEPERHERRRAAGDVAPRLPLARQHGIRGMILLPLKNATRTFGVLAMYCGDVMQTSAEELKLLQNLANDLSFGIGTLRARATAEVEQRLADAHIREQAALLDIAHEAILVLDLQGRILYWNHGAERSYGWSAAEVIGRSFRESMYLSRAAFDESRAALLGSGEWYGELSKRTKDGRLLTVEARWTLVRDEAGAAKAILVIDSDITEKRALEAQLMVSGRMASMGTLAAGVAHEINNPLAALIGTLDFVTESLRRVADMESSAAARAIDTWLVNEISGPLDDAREAAQRVRSIVRDLKMFSRSPSLEASGPVNIKATMEASLRMAGNEVRHRAHVVTAYSAVPHVEANEPRLGQVFLNLIINAAQAMSDDRAEQNEIRISTKVVGETVVVDVSDTGEGIPPENLDRVFEAFFTTKPAGVGTGLGLAICHRIVMDMGGALTVTSELGKGTTFSVALPIAHTRARAPGTPATPMPAVGGRGRGRILVIDDDTLVLRVVHRMLASQHDVVIAGSGKEALALCAEDGTFDLILCDLMMPDMTGMDVHERLSTLAPDLAQRMIFLTGGAFTDKARKFLDEAPVDHIEKPFDTATLRTVVQRHLKESKTRQVGG